MRFLNEGKGELVLLWQANELMEENTVDASYEKHVPAVEKTDEGVLVKVGSAVHPMEENTILNGLK